jgi:hypothetical protein
VSFPGNLRQAERIQPRWNFSTDEVINARIQRALKPLKKVGTRNNDQAHSSEVPYSGLA